MASKKGVCNICGGMGALSRDHVPPRCVVPHGQAVAARFRDLLQPSGPKSRHPVPVDQSLEFRTICRSCNSEKLGTLYDPALAEFASNLTSWVSAFAKIGLSLPNYATVALRPALVARAVFGHLLAADGARDSRSAVGGGSLNIDMRGYFLGTDVPLPASLALYVWPYASDRIVIGKGIGHHDLTSRGMFVADIIKFFPVAFAVVDSSECGSIPPLARIDLLSISSIGDSTEIQIPLAPTPPSDWPEQPPEGGFVMAHGDRLHAIDRRRGAS